MPIGFIAAQSTDMQYIILFSNTSNRQNKRRFRSVDTVLKTSHVVNFRQASGRRDNDDSLGIKQWSSITHPLVSGWGSFGCCKLTCHQTRISLWEHPLWKRAPLVFGMLFYWHVLYKHSWLQFFDAASRSWWTKYLAENDSASWMAR